MKNTMKKFVAIFMAIVLVLALVGCGKKDAPVTDAGVKTEAGAEGGAEALVDAGKKATPTDEAKAAVQELLDAFKAADMETAKQYLNLGAAATDLESVLEYEPFMKMLFSSLDYKILSAEEADAATVNVTVEITARDMKPVMRVAMEKLITYALEANFGETQPNEEEYANNLLNIYTQAMSEAEKTTVTNNVTVAVKKNGEAWQVAAQADFANAVLGNLQTATQDAIAEMNITQ